MTNEPPVRPVDSETAAKKGAPPPDRAQVELEAVRSRWLLAVGFVAWLVAIIGPAISFHVKLSLRSSAGSQFEAFFLILTAAMFLLGWRSLGRLPTWALACLAVASLGLFTTYTLVKDSWTCPYYPNVFNERFTMGTELLSAAAARLKDTSPADGTCESLMEIWGGDAALIWEWNGIVTRFLMLFALYALAWLTLALFILGAVRRSLQQWPRTG